MARRRAIGISRPSPFPTEFIFRLLRALVIVALVLLIVLAGAGGFITYRILSSHNDAENVSPTSFLMSHYENANFRGPGGEEHEGWLLLGLKRAPVIILCHGYNSNRAELLPLGIALRENHFNVYLFNFQAPKGNAIFNNLGVRQTEQLLSAIESVTKRANVNPRRVGLYGTNTGAYAALAVAERSPRVKALVADNVYGNPDQMFDAQMDRLLGGSGPIFRLMVEAEFHLFRPRPKGLWVRENIGKLEPVPKLFISGRDSPFLAAAAEELYRLAPQPKRLLVLDRSQAGIASEREKKEYENQVLSFFLQNLPLRAD